MASDDILLSLTVKRNKRLFLFGHNIGLVYKSVNDMSVSIITVWRPLFSALLSCGENICESHEMFFFFFFKSDHATCINMINILIFSAETPTEIMLRE
jgi:hypothetical protein